MMYERMVVHHKDMFAMTVSRRGKIGYWVQFKNPLRMIEMVSSKIKVW